MLTSDKISFVKTTKTLFIESEIGFKVGAIHWGVIGSVHSYY